MKEITFQGQKINFDLTDSNPLAQLCKPSAVYEVGSKRSSDPVVKLPCKEDDVLVLEYEDGMEWIGRVGDLERPFFESKKTRSGTIRLATGVSLPNKRGFGKIGLKLVQLFVKKKVVPKVQKKLMKELGKKLDALRMSAPGLYKLSPGFEPLPFDPKKVKIKDRHLILLHGFYSDTKGSFKGLYEDSSTVIWNQLKAIYGTNILAFDHHTISQSPISNAIEILELLPKGLELDIFSFSRGGVVADLLSMASALGKDNNASIDVTAISDKQERKYLDKFIALARSKKIKLRRTTRVSCPANGTQLLSHRLDIFLNGLLGAVGLALGSKANPAYQLLKSFITEVAAAREQVDVFPGLAALKPGSDFLNLTNNSSLKPEDELLVIEGDSEIGRRVFRSLAVIFMNLLQGEANDLVVHTDSMRFGLKRKGGVKTFFSESHDVTHFKYLFHGETKSAIYYALKWDGNSELKGFENYDYESLSDQITNGLTRSDLNKRSTRSGDEQADSDLINSLFASSGTRRNVKYEDQLNIEVLYSDLKFARYPVLVGHFAHDEIISAERVLDQELGLRLTDRYLMGKYPTDNDTVEVVLTPSKDHKGGIVVGLGDSVDFTEYVLRVAVRNAILTYVIELRDKYPELFKGNEKVGISPLFVGSSYGGLSMLDSLNSILFGISDANNKIKEINEINFDNPDKRLKPVTEIQFVDIYEDVIKKAMHKLKKLNKNSFTLNIKVPENYTRGAGLLKRIVYEDNNLFWHNIRTKIEQSAENKNLYTINYSSSSGTAKVTDLTEFFSKDLINKIVEKFAGYSINKHDITRLLYNLLVPKRIRHELRNYPNVQWKMDTETAQFPWEMLHDQADEKEPIFVNSGLIRQLVTESNHPYEKITRTQSALIIGDPIYTHMSALEYAQEEAKAVKEIMDNNGWNPKFLLQEDLLEIVSALHGEYKLLHIAGHGTYDIENEQGGIVVEDTILDSHFFKTLPCLPEFVFINCCNSGEVNPEFEERYKHKYKLAASLGMQLIEQGVEAVVITGWEVDDDAAMDFALKFYEKLFDNCGLGDAVKIARKHIYDKYENSITWGAYQCYGNPHYRIDRRKFHSNYDENIDEEALLVKLYNLKSACIKKDENKRNEIKEELEKYLTDKAYEKVLLSPVVLEKIAEVYFELDEIEEAKRIFLLMMEKDKARYSVRSLEQYCNLLIKCEYRLFQKQNEQKKKAKISKKDIAKYLSNFENLLTISDTPERYGLYASAYKRLAYMLPSSRKEYLSEMIANYKLGAGEEGSRNLYQYLNYLQGEYLMHKKYASANSRATAAIKKELKSIRVKLEEPKWKDFWKAIEIVNVLTTELFFYTKIEKTKERIISIYENRFRRRGTLKNLRSEIEHFEFLLELAKNTKHVSSTKKKALADVLKALKNLESPQN